MSVREVARLDRELATMLGARPRDPAACTDVLEPAAFACRTDPIAAETWVEAELLDELVDCYEALGRVDEAITVMRRALQVGWDQPDLLVFDLTPAGRGTHHPPRRRLSARGPPITVR
jgi:Tetratricopeptide repeat